MKKVITAVRVILAVGFTATMLYSGYRIWCVQRDYRAESALHNSVMAYRPPEKQEPAAEPAPQETQAQGGEQAEPGAQDETVNRSILDLQEKYPDTVGWLVLPNTKIDYPFVQAGDNDYYLRRDINGKSSVAGTVFMDYRCQGDFTSQNTIVYGHNMNNGSMFGSLKLFNEKAFFDENPYGTVYLSDETLTLEFFAYMVLRPDDREIYAIAPSDTYFDYVKQNARHYREIGASALDRIVTLSTCAYEFDNARMVLLARIV